MTDWINHDPPEWATHPQPSADQTIRDLQAENTRLAAEMAEQQDQLTAYRACAETDASLNGNLGALLAEARAELAEAGERLASIAALSTQEVRVGMAADTRTAPPFALAVLRDIAALAAGRAE